MGGGNCQTHEKSNENTCKLVGLLLLKEKGKTTNNQPPTTTTSPCYKKMSRRYNNESTHYCSFFSYRDWWQLTTESFG